MDFKYLYNPDNGICGPYSDFVAANRSDLVPITENELRKIANGARLSDVIAARAAENERDVSVSVPIESTIAQDEPQAVLAASEEKKGVVVPDGTPNAVEAAQDAFGNVARDYAAEFRGRATPDDVDTVPDEDLTRFVKEVTGRDFGECPDGDENEVSDWYAHIRNKAKKLVARMAKSRARALKVKEQEAEDGVND